MEITNSCEIDYDESKRINAVTITYSSTNSTVNFTCDEDGYLTYIDASNYDGENKTVYWENGDIARIKYNESGPIVYYEYGEIINSASTNIDFNYILNKNELSEWFIDSEMFKALDCWGKRTKHYKIREYGYSTPSDGNIYEKLVYTCELDSEGYVTQITEQSKGYGDEDKEGTVNTYRIYYTE